MSHLQVLEFRPYRLLLSRVGPFQEGVMEVPFVDAEGEPSNLYLLLSENGRGKTTILDSTAFLLGLLDPREDMAPPWLADHPGARLQLDLLVRYRLGDLDSGALLSFVYGDTEDPTLGTWDSEEGKRLMDRLGVSSRAWLGVGRTPGGALSRIGAEDVLVRELRALIETGERSFDPQTGTSALPSVLYFTDRRSLVRPLPPGERAISAETFRFVRRFECQGDTWQGSLDNLLVWLYWLDDGRERFPKVQELVNREVFRSTGKRLAGIQKFPAEAYIEHEGHRHRLDQLSSGERSLLQLLVEFYVWRSANTILIIDEIDLHLHPRWERRVLSLLRRLVLEDAGLTILFSSHSKDVLDRFDHRLREPPLRKSGFIIEEGFVGARRAEEG